MVVNLTKTKVVVFNSKLANDAFPFVFNDNDVPISEQYYAVNWCVSRWNGRDTMDVIFFFISRPGGLTH